MAFIDHHISPSRIRLRRSTVPGETPDAGELRPGEIAANVADGIMFVGKSDGTSAQVSGEVDEAPEDGGTYARKDGEWIDIEEAANLQINRGNTAEVADYTPLSGEPVWDETTKNLFVGDGTTQGGVLVGRRVLASGFSSAQQVTSATYSKLVNVTLLGNGSRWRVTGTLAFHAIDAVDANIQIDLNGVGGTVLRGAAWISAPAGVSYKHHSEGEVTITIAESETAKVEIDYVVQLASSSVSFGIPIRRTSGTQAAYVAYAEGEYSVMYAERLL